MEGEYIVALVGHRGVAPYVAVRQVPPGSCAFTLPKRSAWEQACRLAKPKGRRKHTLNAHFTNLDGLTMDVGPAIPKEDLT